MNHPLRKMIVMLLALCIALPVALSHVEARTASDWQPPAPDKWGEPVRADVEYPNSSAQTEAAATTEDNLKMVGIAVESDYGEGYYDFYITALTSTSGITDGQYGSFTDSDNETYTGYIYKLYTDGFSTMDIDIRNNIVLIESNRIWQLSKKTTIDFSFMPNLRLAYIGLDNVDQYDENTGMFEGDFNLETVSLILSNIKYASNMFSYCTSLWHAGLSGCDFSQVITTEGMFYNCVKLISEQDVWSKDISNVRKTDFMYWGCESMRSVDLTGFDSTKTPIGSGMFGNTYSLSEVWLGDKWGKGWTYDQDEVVSSALSEGYWYNVDCDQIKTNKQLADDYWAHRTEWVGPWRRMLELALGGYNGIVMSSEEGLTVKWEPMEGADKYNVYLDEERVGSTAGNSYQFKKLQMGESLNIKITTRVNDRLQKLIIKPTFNPFEDIPMYSYDYEPVAWLYNHAIAKGTSDTTFSPLANCTRAQFCIMLYKMFGKPDVSVPDELPFSDIANQTVNTKKAIIWCSEQEIIEGKNGKFNPKGNITRAQLAIMLYKLAGKPNVSGLSTPFTDLKGQTSNTKNAIIWLYNNGMDQGISSTKFGPKVEATRSQLTHMLFGYNEVYDVVAD